MANTVVITGASRGIGKATAQLFIDKGYRVINLSRKPCAVAGVHNMSVDLADKHWVEAQGEELLARVGAELADQVDLSGSALCVIHNAALMLKDSTRTLQVDALERVFQVNVFAPAQLNCLLLPLMQGGSSILYVSSTLGEKAVPGTASYVMSKHAAVGQMRATCQDLKGSGIHTACVCPGFTDTEMLRDHLGNDQSILDSMCSEVTFGRLIEPREIADTLYFCAQSPVINGAVLHANLGQVEH